MLHWLYAFITLLWVLISVEQESCEVRELMKEWLNKKEELCVAINLNIVMKFVTCVNIYLLLLIN